MNLKRCIDCNRLLPIERLSKCLCLAFPNAYSCKRKFKRECIEVRYIEDPPSEVRKEEALKRFAI